MINRGDVVRFSAPLVAAAVLAGCVTESETTSDGRPMPPQPRALREAPAGAPAQYMMLIHGAPNDANGNGYPDTIPVFTQLWFEPRYQPLVADGAFVFRLYRRGEVNVSGREPLREWRFDAAATRTARSADVNGACYRFRLNLLDGGTDEMSALQCDLRGRFEPVEGELVETSDEPRRVQLGRWLSEAVPEGAENPVMRRR